MKTYYLLLVQYSKGEPWSIEFGDYSKEVVEQEKEDTEHGFHKSKVFKTVENYNTGEVLKGVNSK